MQKNNSFSFQRKFRICAFLLLLIFFALRFSFTIVNKVPHINSFFKHKADYAKLRLKYIDLADPLEAAKFLPLDAHFDISDKEWFFPRISARYVLYPRILTDYWDYYLDVNNVQKNPPKEWKSIKLRTGAMLYARKGFDFVETKPIKPSFTKAVVIICVVSGLYIMVGLMLCSLMQIPVKPGGLLWFFSTSYLLGLLLLNSVLWLYLFLGGTFHVQSVCILWIIVIAGLYMYSRKKLKQTQVTIKNDFKLMLSNFFKVSDRSLVILLTGITAFVMMDMIQFPVLSWDAMAHWIIKAKVIFHQEGLNFHYTYYNVYPLIWPMKIASLFALFGTDYDGLAILSITVLFLMFIGQFVGAVNILRLKRLWRLMPLIFFLTFFLHPLFYSTAAESIFMVYLLAVVTAVLAWMNNGQEKRFLYLSVWMVFGLSLVKFEGWPTVFIVLIAILLSQFKNISLKQSFKIIILYFLPLIIVVGWVSWAKYLGYTQAMNHFRDPITIGKIFYIFQQVLIKISELNLLYMMMISVMLLTIIFNIRRYKRDEVFLCLALMGMALFSCAAIAGWPKDEIVSQINVATNRLFLHATPVLALWWGSLILDRDLKVEGD